MKSETVRIAELQSRDKTIAEIMGVIKHPIFMVLLVFIITEYLQKFPVGPKKEPLMGSVVGTMLETGIVAGPVLTSLAQSSAEALKGLASIVPLIATKGAGA